MELENLIRSLLAEMLPLLRKRLLILLSGGTVNGELLLNTLADHQFVKCEVLMTAAARKMIDGKLIENLKGQIIDSVEEIDGAIARANLILIPVMTRNTLSKVALGIADNLVTTAIARSILMQKEIIGVRDSYDPQLAPGPGAFTPYHELFLDYEERVRGYGIKLIDSREFSHAIYGRDGKEPGSPSLAPQGIKGGLPGRRTPFRSSVLTVADLHQLHDQGTITLPEGTVITPLAKDYIRHHQMEVAMVGSGGRMNMLRIGDETDGNIG